MSCDITIYSVGSTDAISINKLIKYARHQLPETDVVLNKTLTYSPADMWGKVASPWQINWKYGEKKESTSACGMKMHIHVGLKVSEG